MQLIVVPSTNTPVNVQVSSSVQKTTTNPIYVNVGETLSLSLIGTNLDNGTVLITQGGSALMNTNATTSTSTPSNNEFISTISWTPSLNEVKPNPYYLSFRVADYSAPFVFYNDLTFRIIITNNTTGINENVVTKNRQLIKIVDMLGRDIDPESEGFRINIYSDGTKEKIYIKK